MAYNKSANNQPELSEGLTLDLFLIYIYIQIFNQTKINAYYFSHIYIPIPTLFLIRPIRCFVVNITTQLKMYLFKDMKLFNWSDVLKTHVKLAHSLQNTICKFRSLFYTLIRRQFYKYHIFICGESYYCINTILPCIYIYRGLYALYQNCKQVNYKYAMMIKSLSETFSFRLTVINCEIKATKEFSY